MAPIREITVGACLLYLRLQGGERDGSVVQLHGVRGKKLSMAACRTCRTMSTHSDTRPAVLGLLVLAHRRQIVDDVKEHAYFVRSMRSVAIPLKSVPPPARVTCSTSEIHQMGPGLATEVRRMHSGRGPCCGIPKWSVRANSFYNNYRVSISFLF